MSAFTEGQQSAGALGAAFNAGDVKAGVASGVTDVTVSIAHGLSAAPTFLIALAADGGQQGSIVITASATTIFLKSATDSTQSISYIAAVLT